MSRSWKIARREFRGYFDHPTAYVLVVGFLAVTLFLGFQALYSASVASLRPLFDFLPWVLAVFVPAITMRSLAEERRSGTLEWLMAQPVTEVDVVLGKFLGDWLFSLVALAGLLPAGLGLLLVADPDPGVMAAQFVGAALLAATLVAVGLFASSVTENQITAFILAAVVSFALVLAGTSFTLQGLPTVLSGPVGQLSVLTHFRNVIRGVLDLRDVLYFLTAAGLFLALAYHVVASERLSARRGARRRLRLGVAGLVTAVVTLNLLGGHIRGRADLTRDDLYTLSDGTKQVLDRAGDVINVRLFISRELPAQVQVTVRDLRDLLEDYRRASDGNLRVSVLRPDESDEAREEARSLGVRPIQFNVLEGNQYQVQRGWLGLAILHAGERETLPVVRNTGNLEYRLTSAIASVMAERTPRVAFLTGFGAGGPSSYPGFREMLARNYEIRTVSLAGDSVPRIEPDSARVAILAAPLRRVSSAARARIREYLDGGGAALVLTEGVDRGREMPRARPIEDGLDSLLLARGVRPVGQMLYDVKSNQRLSTGGGGPFSVVRPYPLWPVVVPAGDHLVTRGLQGVTLGWARPLEVTDSTRVEPLLQTTKLGGRTSASGSIMPDRLDLSSDPSRLSKQTAAVAVREPGEDSGGTGGRLVVVGDANFLDRNFVRASRQNLVFAANAVDWLARDDALIAIRSKDRSPPRLIFETDRARATLKWVNLAGVPLLFVLLGTARVVRRRRITRQIFDAGGREGRDGDGDRAGGDADGVADDARGDDVGTREEERA